MYRILHNSLAAVCGMLAGILAACSSDAPAEIGSDKDLIVTIATRGPRMADRADSLHSDLEIHEGIVLIYDENGVYEAGEKIDPDKMQASLRVTKGVKRIVAVANPPKALRDLIAVDCHEPAVDEFGYVKTYKGDTIWRNIKPVHNLYADLPSTLTLTKGYLEGILTSHRMLLIHDAQVTITTSDNHSGYVEIPLTSPIARVDLHARCMADESSRVAGAAIRVTHVSPSLNWNYTRPAEEGEVTAEFSGVSGRMTTVEKSDELLGDWVMTTVKEDAPVATLYTYHTDTKVKVEVGLRFAGSADYDWYPIDMAGLLENFKGLEAGHLYQIFISVYPDKVGHIIVDPWVVPSNLEFTIG